MSQYTQTFVQKSPQRSRIPFSNILSGLLLIALCFVSIVSVNRSVSMGYQMRELESTIHELTLNNQQLETLTQQSQSLTKISRAVKMIGLVDAEQPTYLTSQPPAYALAK